MLQILNIAQLVLYIGLFALVGQALLFILAGAHRDKNFFYQLFQILNRPWTAIAQKISPSKVAPQHIPFVAFFVLAVFYIAVTMAKIEHCVTLGMQGCK